MPTKSRKAYNNTLTDLNDILFKNIREMSEMDVRDDDFEKAVSKADTITRAAGQIVNNARLQLEAVIKTSNLIADDSVCPMPMMLETKKEEER